MCGIFGVRGHPDAIHLAQLGLYSLQHRGQESFGIVSIDDTGNAFALRSMGTLSEAKAEPLEGHPGSTALGHTRYSTAGRSSIENAQPGRVRSSRADMWLAQNVNP